MTEEIQYPLDHMQSIVERIHSYTDETSSYYGERSRQAHDILLDIPNQLRAPLERLIQRMDGYSQQQHEQAHKLAHAIAQSQGSMQIQDQRNAQTVTK